MAFDLTKFLQAFGYLPPDVAAADDDAVERAVAKAQEAYGLPVTGDVDPMTERVLGRTPRCGVSDAEGLADGQAYWGLPEITWQAESVPTGVGLARGQVEAAIAEAFGYWSALIPIDFRMVARNANIVFRTGRGTRSDFDGPGGTLAWMELCPRPKFTGQLNGAFDGDEPFVVNLQSSGVRLVNVACHEIGHALGFSHSRRAAQLMSPTYHRDLVKPQSEDITRVQAAYGVRTTPIPPTTPGPTPAGSVECEVRIGGPGGNVFAGTLNPKA